MTRRDAVAKLLAARDGALVVTGLGSPSYDVHAAGDRDDNYYLWGAMGGAALVGLGLAQAQPAKRIMVITGDGEQLMAFGALATISVAAPKNLDIIVLDNQHFVASGALTSLAISLAPHAFAMSEIVTWLMGALTDRGWPDVWIAAPLSLTGIVLLRLAGPGLDALSLGEHAARSLGMNPVRLRWLMVLGTGLSVGGGVAVAGIIGFVGLIVPHLVRPLTDRRPSSLIVPSALAGALLLLLADVLCRIVPLVTELRLGIALSLLGSPFFLWLLLRMRRGLA